MGPSTTRLLHLTDTHIAAHGAPHFGVDTCAALRSVLDRAGRSHPDVVVVSGDVSDDGSVDSYRRVSAMVREWADREGASVIWAMGNHDRRSAFRAVLGSQPGQPDVLMARRDHDEDSARVVSSLRESSQSLHEGSESLREEPVSSLGDFAQSQPPVFGGLIVNGVEFLVLDTSVPGRGYGHIGSTQLSWLRRRLSARPQIPAVLVMHHPPIAAATQLLNGLGLDDAQALRDLLRGSRVRLVLSGHYHGLEVSTICGGITTVVGAPVTAQADTVGDPNVEVALRGAGASIIDLRIDRARGDGDVTLKPFTVPDHEGEGRVFVLERDEVRRIVERSGVPGFSFAE